MTSGGSSSLRDLYTSNSPSWAFVPPAEPNGSPSVATPASAPEPATPWNSSRPRPNSIYELSPGLSLEPTGSNAAALLKAFAASAVLTYLGVAVEMPFEVAKRLLQVQYVPRNAKAVEDLEWEEDEEAEEQEIEESGSEAEGYFADEAAEAHRTRASRPTRPTDERGYVIRQNISDEGTRATYVIPLGRASGIWDMIKEIGNHKPEGWLALWKGLATTSVYRLIEASIKPIIHSILSNVFSSIYHSPNSSVFSSNHQIILPVLSNVVTGLLLSPLDLIATRLIVQSSVSRYKRYTGPFDAFRQIVRDEGGLRGIYLHPQLLYPAIVDHALTALVEALSPRLVSRLFGSHISEDTHPILWAFAQLVGSCAGALLILPIQTARRRLQVQTRGTAASLHTCIEVRPRPYYGIVDAMYAIVTEERSDLPLKPTRHLRERRMSRSKKGKTREAVVEGTDVEEQGGWLRNTGIGQLYRGLNLNVTGSILIFLLAIFAGPDTDDGWTEL